MLGYSYKAAKLRRKRRSKRLVAPIVKDVVWLAIRNMMDTPSFNGRLPSVLSRDEARHILANIGSNCLSRFNGLNEEKSWLWKTQLTMSILSFQ